MQKISKSGGSALLVQNFEWRVRRGSRELHSCHLTLTGLGALSTDEQKTPSANFIDPATLTTLGRIHLHLPPKSSKLNRISSGPDGTTVYVEGSIPQDPKSGDAGGACCVLYSIDLTTMQTRQVADIEMHFYAPNAIATWSNPFYSGL